MNKNVFNVTIIFSAIRVFHKSPLRPY